MTETSLTIWYKHIINKLDGLYASEEFILTFVRKPPFTYSNSLVCEVQGEGNGDKSICETNPPLRLQIRFSLRFSRERKSWKFCFRCYIYSDSKLNVGFLYHIKIRHFSCHCSNALHFCNDYVSLEHGFTHHGFFWRTERTVMTSSRLAHSINLPSWQRLFETRFIGYLPLFDSFYLIFYDEISLFSIVKVKTN